MDSYEQINKQFYAVFDNSVDGIWICDNKGIVLRVNRAAQENSRFREQDIVGKSIYNALELGFIQNSATAKTLETKKQQSVLEYKKDTGKTLLITATPIFDENGELSLIIANERDITQLNALKLNLESSRLQTEKIKDELTEQYLKELSNQDIIAKSRGMENVLLSGVKLARVGVSNILITGESGTGKGMIASYIHRISDRRYKPFIHINCAAIPVALMEAELFGYEKGAFTGARQNGKSGLFELAHEGTLFLDEIGELPFHMQAKLLTYLDDNKIMRIGGTTPVRVECAIIAATNQDLKSAIKKKQFRADLYYRLSSFSINIPPLRQRQEDITELIRFFMDKYNKQFKQNRQISKQALDAALSYNFPGNVRELKDIVKRAVVLGTNDVINNLLSGNIDADDSKDKQILLKDKPIFDLGKAILATERKAFVHAIRHCRSTREVASYLNISQTKAVRCLRKHKLDLNVSQI